MQKGITMITLVSKTSELFGKPYPVFLDMGGGCIIPNFMNIEVQISDNHSPVNINDEYDEEYPLSVLEMFKYNFKSINIFSDSHLAWEQGLSTKTLAENEFHVMLGDIQNRYIDELKKTLSPSLNISFDANLIYRLKGSFSSSNSKKSNGFYRLYKLIICGLENNIIVFKKDILRDLQASSIFYLSSLCTCQKDSMLLYNTINIVSSTITTVIDYMVSKFIRRLKEYYIPSMYCGLYVDDNKEIYVTPKALNIDTSDESPYLLRIDQDNKSLERIDLEEFRYPRGYTFDDD